MNPPLIRERDGAVLNLTLDRPQARNALSPELVCRLADALQDFASDDSLHVAILTGAGNQAFCSGGDLGTMLPLLSGARPPADEWDHRVLEDPKVMAASSLRGFPLDKPLIAAVNGTCVAAGAELLLGTDIRIAADSARFGWPEVSRGLVPFAGSMARLPRQIGFAAAMQLLLTGELIEAAEALRIGLVNRVVPASHLLDEARAIARRIAAHGPLAVQTVKQTAQATSGLPLAQAFELEDAAARRVLSSEDAREGPRAFMDKREPRWSGR